MIGRGHKPRVEGNDWDPGIKLTLGCGWGIVSQSLLGSVALGFNIQVGTGVCLR